MRLNNADKLMFATHCYHIKRSRLFLSYTNHNNLAFLNNIDNASITIRKQLIEECNLFGILDLPKGVFLGTGVETVVLFFEKGKPTEKIWYYQLKVQRNFGKTNSLNENDLSEFIELSKKKQTSDKSWFVNIDEINKDTYDLNVKNPNKIEEIDNRSPKEILAEIEKLDLEEAKLLKNLKEYI